MRDDLDDEADAIKAVADAAENKDTVAANAEPETDEANETAEGQDDSESPPEDEEEKKSRSQRQRERRKAILQQRESERDEARAEVERLKKVKLGREEPREDDFDDPNEYSAARAFWKFRQQDVDEQSAEATAKLERIEQQRQQELHNSWQERIADVTPKYEDFHKVALDPAVPVTPDMAEIIMSSEVGPDVLYHLGSHREIAAQIASLPPAQQAYRLGQIEARLTAPKPRTATSAPQPIKPVGGRSSGEKDPSKMTMAEYAAWRTKGGK